MTKQQAGVRQPNQTLGLVGEMDATEVVGNRLYKIRYVATHSDAWKGKRTQKAFAEALGFAKDSYNQWELGRSGKTKVMFPIEAAVTICDWSGNGVTLDYIYRGRPDDLGRGWSLPLIEAPDRLGFAPPSQFSPPRVFRTIPSPRRRG